MKNMNAKEFFIKHIIANEADFNRYILSKVYTKDLANDILQEAYARAWKNLDSLKYETKVRNWMYGIIKNCIREYWRKAVKDEKIMSNIVETDSGPMDLYEMIKGNDDVLETVITNFETELAYETLMYIKEEYRILIHMRYVECLTVKEMAEITGKKEKTVSSKLSRAVKKYREVYFKLESGEEVRRYD
ncbi:MAG: RNA polymerase sigma factor [Firmicutes bacterium]|nr:RNA polymerase sigma factor [Bacillota bacterium]